MVPGPFRVRRRSADAEGKASVGVSGMRAVVQRSITFGGRKTSVTVDDAFWDGLKEIADRRQMTLADLVVEIDAQRQHSNLSSAIRLYVLEYYRSQIPDTPDGDGRPRG